MWPKRVWQTAREFWTLPRVTINLMVSATKANDPFYERMVFKHYQEARRRRPTRLFLPAMVHGVALSQLPSSYDEYYMRIDGSARRNHKKSLREGCEVRRIAFNEHLGEIGEVWTSTDTRQGRLMPKSYREGRVQPISDPPSLSPLHDYPYFGVFLRGKLIGYAGCIVAGEYCGIEQVLGHADYLPFGVVPLLFVGIARHLYEHHNRVKYYAYGTYYGASETLRRFKRKFDFHPHRVTWLLDAETPDPQPATPTGATPKP
jgi:hypothetical protein